MGAQPGVDHPPDGCGHEGEDDDKDDDACCFHVLLCVLDAGDSVSRIG